jgi:hypothetical protein
VLFRLGLISQFNMDGQCGICGLTGPLLDIQTHFMRAHVNDNVNELNQSARTENGN